MITGIMSGRASLWKREFLGGHNLLLSVDLLNEGGGLSGAGVPQGSRIGALCAASANENYLSGTGSFFKSRESTSKDVLVFEMGFR